jgi:hypothetical protein
MNQGPRYVHLMEKSRGKKSRATVPLSKAERLTVPGVLALLFALARGQPAQLQGYPIVFAAHGTELKLGRMI